MLLQRIAEVQLNRQVGQHEVWTIGVYRKQGTGAMEVAHLGACGLMFDGYKINHFSPVRRRVGLGMMLPPSCPLFQNVYIEGDCHCLIFPIAI